ncbi:hypothetical protein USDA257_c28860 [Sinorhizobium fredii USDA 257]|uniref:Uncharacterized protein n=1 Tax=Sinorhizobium fredii (strain USDA 257) TaxID=1185652 RepID=I3X6F1_SINF2|nr:hypothetical protein USDA257_c28860 [Sinorhizobium fredii USDA 257]
MLPLGCVVRQAFPRSEYRLGGLEPSAINSKKFQFDNLAMHSSM